MGVKVNFHSVILDGEIKFSRASNGFETASFCIRKGNEKYKMILFSDANDQNCYTRMKTCVEKNFLTKGKLIWIEAEMTYYEKSVIPDDAWNMLVSSLPEKTVKAILGSTENPSKAKFPRFKVTDWDFAIPKGYLKGTNSSGYVPEQTEQSSCIKPLDDLSKWG